MEHETIEGKHVHEIVEYGEIRTPVKKAASVIHEEKKKREKEKAAATAKGKEVDDPSGDPAGAMA